MRLTAVVTIAALSHAIPAAVFDGSANIDRQTTSGAVSAPDHTTWGFSAVVGPRWYGSLGDHVARFVGFGVTGGYSEISSGGSASAHAWSAGMNGETGATYPFTPHFGLGARFSISGTRIATHNAVSNPFGGSTSVDMTDYRLQINPARVLATLFF